MRLPRPGVCWRAAASQRACAQVRVRARDEVDEATRARDEETRRPESSALTAGVALVRGRVTVLTLTRLGRRPASYLWTRSGGGAGGDRMNVLAAGRRAPGVRCNSWQGRAQKAGDEQESAVALQTWPGDENVLLSNRLERGKQVGICVERQQGQHLVFMRLIDVSRARGRGAKARTASEVLKHFWSLHRRKPGRFVRPPV